MQGASAAELHSVRSKAAEAITDFIRFPDLYQFDLLEADAVKQLQKDPEYGPLYQLLSMMLTSASIKVSLCQNVPKRAKRAHGMISVTMGCVAPSSCTTLVFLL